MESTLRTIDWAGMFTPARSILEMVARATIMYLAIVVLLKLVVKRQTGVGRPDILVIVVLRTSTSSVCGDQWLSTATWAFKCLLGTNCTLPGTASNVRLALASPIKQTDRLRPIAHIFVSS